MAEWQGVLQTTIRKYIREVEDTIMRNRKLMAKLQAAGAVDFNLSGEQMEWRVKFRRASLQGSADSDMLTFARINRHKRANLDWRGYASTDSVTKKEKLMNKGTEAIINRFSQAAEMLMEDIEENFGDELYIDGGASGNEKRIHGIESFMSGAVSAVTGSVAMQPAATYANLSTALGNYGGTWTGTWPNGKGSPEYDFWSPLIVDVTSTLAAASGGWSSATKTFAANAAEQLRYGIINARKNKSKRGQLDTIFLDSLFYRQFAESLASKERIVVDRGTTNSLVSLGFNDVINFEGAEVTYEFGMPASTGYGFNTDQLRLMSLQGQLFGPEGPDYDMATQSFRFSIDFYGNLRFRSPRNFVKWFGYGTAG